MKNLARDYDDGMMDMKSKKRRMKPSEPGDPSMDLITPDMLPDKPVIPPGREMGGGIKKKAGGGSVYARGAKVGSASSRADGCAERGKTKGKFV
jgi:hypothetical protein